MAAMEKNELVELWKKVEQAAAKVSSSDGGAEEVWCLEGLSCLRTFPINIKLLVATNLGKKVRSLTRHPSKKISNLATHVVQEWKKKAIVEQDTMILKKSIKFQKPIIHRSIPKTNDAWRDKVRVQIFEGLCKVFNEAREEDREKLQDCDPVQVLVCLESDLFRKWGGNCKGRNNIKYRSLLFNLKDAKNPDFRKRVLLGEVEAESIAELTSLEMASDEMKKLVNKIETNGLLKRLEGLHVKGTTDQFMCDRCGDRQTTYYQMQTRSADEPMTTYVTCMSCNNHWKFC